MSHELEDFSNQPERVESQAGALRADAGIDSAESNSIVQSSRESDRAADPHVMDSDFAGTSMWRGDSTEKMVAKEYFSQGGDGSFQNAMSSLFADSKALRR